jgi:hypothetical protein
VNGSERLLANATEAVRHGRIHIEKINGQLLYEHRGTGGLWRRAEARD